MKKEKVEAKSVASAGEATPLLSKGHGLSRAVTDQGEAPPLPSKGQGFSPAVTDRGGAPPALPKARANQGEARPPLSKGHGLSRAVTNPRSARTLLPQAASSGPAGQLLRETGNGKRETAPKPVPLCKYIHFDGRRCQSPVHRKPRTTELGLCFQHCIRLRLHPVMEARRAANALRAQLDLKLTAARRAQRTIDDCRARAIRPFAHIPILDSYENIDRARQNIEYAAAVGAFDERTTRILLNTLRVARLAVKHTKGPMYAEGYTPPGFVKGPMGFTPLITDLRKALQTPSKGHGLSRAVTDRGEAPSTLPKAALTPGLHGKCLPQAAPRGFHAPRSKAL